MAWMLFVKPAHIPLQSMSLVGFDKKKPLYFMKHAHVHVTLQSTNLVGFW